MLINIFGISNSNIFGDKNDTRLYVQKTYLNSNYIESNFGEDIDLKNQYRLKNIPDPISIREIASKNYVDNIYKNDIDSNGVKLENIKIVEVNYQPAVNEHLTPKIYVDNAIDEASLVRNIQDNDSANHNLTHINSNSLNNEADNVNEVNTEAYVDQFHNDNERSRRDIGLSFSNEEVDLVKKIKTMISTIIN